MAEIRAIAEAASPSMADDSGDPRVVAAMKEYLALLEAGEKPVRREFLARHAAIAENLAECLNGLDFVHAAAGNLKQEEEESAGKRIAGVPKALGDFRLLREIGRGGMGVVFEALQVSLGRRVALKVLPFVSAFDEMRLQRFKIEAQAAARLQHANIVPVYAVGCERDIHFYAMQRIEGFPLSALISYLRKASGRPSADRSLTISSSPPREEIAGGNRLPAATQRDLAGSTDRNSATDAVGGKAPHDDTLDRIRASELVQSYASRQAYFRKVVTAVRQAAEALEHAHQCGVVHRDVKPANLLVDGTGHLWVADFGLAQMNNDMQLTYTGDALGTIRYMSPEQAAGKKGAVDPRADVYSLAVTLYELLTLESAISGDSHHELLRNVMDEEPRSLRSLDSQIPVDLETIVLKAASKSAADRYPSMGALSADLQRWLDDQPIRARPPTVWERAVKWRRRHRILVRAAAVFAGLALCGLLMATFVVARAYERESAARKSAEASFVQAREAVDAFSELGETELAARPEFRDVRRRFLETSLEYYNQFLAEHRNDPSAATDLAATSERTARIVDELRILDDYLPLLLLTDESVQADLQLSDEQRDRIHREFSQSPSAPGDGNQGTQQRLTDRMSTHFADLAVILNAGQLERLRQIARQQRAPFAFRDSETIEALSLTKDQRQQINTIIEDERVDKRDRLGGPARGPDSRRPRRPPPSEFDRDGPPADDFPSPGPPPDAGRFGDGPPQGDRRPPRPPPRHFEGREPPPRPRGDRPPDHGPSPMGPHDSDPGGPGNLSESKKRATDRILALLSPSQREAWDRLVGKPFQHDLQLGPDDVAPH